jgi:ribosomal protein S18 acetylase RimI-like enzyme
LNIQPVTTADDLRRFIRFPYTLYRGDPNWVPWLKSEQKALFNPRKNAMLGHCEYALFLLCDDNKVIGRIAAFYDKQAISYWNEPIGLFGSYECINDTCASRMLLQTASDWLRAQGMQTMRGPWSFSSQEWGIVVEGFSPPPVILAPYNPPWYATQFADFGLKKAKDLLVFYGDTREGYAIPERFSTFSEMIRQKHGVTVRILDRERLAYDVQCLVRLTNQAIADNWGYYPVGEEEAQEIARSLKRIVDPEMVFIAENEQAEAVGFAMSLPDINQLLKNLNGRLLPLGWFHLLTGMKRITQYRMWGLGIVPSYQGKAIDVLLYLATYEALKKRGARLEIKYVLEDNYLILNAIIRLKVKPLRRYRVYERDIS